MSTHARKSTGRNLGGKFGRLMIAGPLVGLASLPALAGPTGEQVVYGSAEFFREGNHTYIRTSDLAIINYSGFDLASWESVQFLQPGAGSRVLNRIQSAMPTMIDGSVSANGSVYFVNRAGVVFGQNAVFNVGSLYAAAGNISNRDFIAGNDHFTDLSGEVVNRGRIEAGEVSLLGRRVANYGQIVAPEGMVTFASADEVFIGQRGSHVFARITGGSDGPDAGIEQAGSIVAGQVNLTVGDHVALAVMDGSTIKADRVTIQGGRDSTVRVSGEIDARRDGATGGQVDIFGERIVLQGAQIDASGQLGGGVIRIGGDLRGGGDAPHARYTLVDADTTLRADALQSGAGGRVILWSDQGTAFGGYISARGGPMNGDGGFVEVSGKQLHYVGLADVRALGEGRGGTLLLDPTFITITSAPGNNWPVFGADGEIDFSEGVDNTLITDTVLAAQLNAMNSGDILRLEASTDIRFRNGTSVIASSMASGAQLVLDAGRSILWQGSAVLDLGSGSLLAFANSASFTPVEFERLAGQAEINMSEDSIIRTNGGTLDLRVQNSNQLVTNRDSGNLIVSTLDAGATGTVRLIHTGVIGGSGHFIEQVASANPALGITAGSTVIRSTTGGRVGRNATERVRVFGGSLQLETAGGDAFLDVQGALSIVGTGVTTANGRVDLLSNSTLDLQTDIDAGAGLVDLDVADITSAGGSIAGSQVRLNASGGSLGADGAHLSVTADVLAASASGDVFLDTQSLGGGAMSIGTIEGLSGLTSANGLVTLMHTGDLSIDQAITATGHGLTTDVIRVDAATVAFGGAGGVDAGPGGMVFNTDSLTVDGTFAGALNGRAATFNVGTGGVDIGATLAGFEDITFNTTGAFVLSAGGDVDATSDLSITAASFDLGAGTRLRAVDTMSLTSSGAIDFDQTELDLIEISGAQLAITAQGGDLTLAGPTAAFGTVAQTVLDASGGIFLNGPAATTYVFNDLSATAGNGITFGATVDALSATTAMLDAGAGEVNILRGGMFNFDTALDLRSDVRAEQAGGGVLFSNTVDASNAGGDVEVASDLGGIEITNTFSTGAQNVALTTAGGTVMVSGAVETTGANITVNLGAGSLSLTGGGTRLNAGTGVVTLTADAWTGGSAFDGSFIDQIVAGELTVQALAAGGNVDVSGPSTTLDDIALVRFASDSGLVRLLGTGDYNFASVELLGGTGVELGADVTGLHSTNGTVLNGGAGVVNLLNPAGFTLSSDLSTRLQSELITSGDLVVLGQLIFDGGFINAGSLNVALDGSYFDLTAGDPVVITTGTLSLIGMTGNHEFYIGDDAQIVAASAGDPNDVLIGNTFLQRLRVGQLDVGNNTDTALTSTLGAHMYSVAASDLIGGVDPRIGTMRVFARDEISFNEQTSSFRNFEAHVDAGAASGIIVRLADSSQRIEAIGGGLAFVGTTRLNGTDATTIEALDGAVRFWGTLDLADAPQLVINASDVDFRDMSGAAAGSVISNARQTLTLIAGNAGLVEIGDVTAPAGGMHFDQLDLASIDASIGLIEFGQLGGSDMDIVVGDDAGTALSFVSAVSLNALAPRQVRFESGLTLVTAGDAVTVNSGDVVIDGSATITTTDGSIEFATDVRGATAGVDSLTLDAGAGNIRLLGSIGAGVDQHLALLQVLNATNVEFGGASYEAVTQSYTSSGQFDMNRVGGGTVSFVSHGNNIAFMGGDIRLALNTDLELHADNGGNIDVTSSVFRDAGDTDAQVLASGSGTVSFGTIGTSTERLEVLTIAGDEINFTGGADSVFGNNIAMHEHSTDRGIVIGGDGLDADNVNLTETDLAALATGAMITVGRDETDDIVFVPGGTALTLRHMYDLRAAAVRISRDIDGTAGGAITTFTPALILENTNIALGGWMRSFRPDGTPGSTFIRGNVSIDTNGGVVNFAGQVEGTSGTVDRLTIQTDGNTAVIGPVGAVEALHSLHVNAGELRIHNIGNKNQNTVGVLGNSILDATGELRFIGSYYSTGGGVRYASTTGMRLLESAIFQTNNATLQFGEPGVGRGSLTLEPNGGTLTVNTGTGDILINGVYTGTNADMTFTGGRLLLNGDSGFANAGGTVTIDAPISGAGALDIAAAGGTINLLRNIGGEAAGEAIGALTLAADTINLRMRLAHFASGSLTGVQYVFNPIENSFEGQRFIAETGDLIFARGGSQIRFEPFAGNVQAQLSLVSRGGNVQLADVVGGASSTSLTVSGFGIVDLNSVGTDLASGVNQLLITAQDVVLNGDLHYRSAALLRPFTDGNAIHVGAADDVSTTSIMEISQATLDRFIADTGALLGIGGFSSSNDPNDAAFDVINLHSLSDVQIFSFDFGSALSIFGQNIEVLNGQQVSMHNGAQIRLSSEDTTTLNGVIDSEGGRVVVNGTNSILNSDIVTHGGDIMIRSTALIGMNANLDTSGVADDGDFIVTGGIEGLSDGVGDFVLNVGRGNIVLAPGAGIGQTNRLHSVRLTAQELELSNVGTTGDQDYFGTTSLSLVGGTLQSESGNITFHHDLLLAGDQVISTGGNGMVVFNGRIDGAMQKPVEGLTIVTGVDGATQFFQDVSDVDTLRVVRRSMLMADNLNFAGGTLSFGQLEAVGGNWNLVIDASTRAELLGSVGQGNMLTTLKVSGPTIAIGTAGEAMRIDSLSEQRYTGDVMVAGADVTMQAHGSAGGVVKTDSLVFDGSVVAETGGTSTLTLLVDRTLGDGTGLNDAPDNVPVIWFNGDLGSAGHEFAAVNLNADGREANGDSFVSAVGTVIFGDPFAYLESGTLGSFQIHADTFNIGFGEAIVAIGDLSFHGGTATVADVATLGNLAFNVNTLNVRSRDGARKFDPIAGPTQDDGADLVAAGAGGISFGPGLVFNILANPTTGEASTVFFGAANGNVNLAPGNTLTRSLPDGTKDLFIDNTAGNGNPGLDLLGPIVLDVRSAGPSNTNIAEALAGVAQVSELGDVDQGSLVPSTVRDLLQELGITLREAPETYFAAYAASGDPTLLYAGDLALRMKLDALEGTANYVDVSGPTDGSGNFQTILSIERLNKELAEQVLAGTFAKLWRQVRDDQGNALLDENGQPVIDMSGLDDNGALAEALFPVIDACTAERNARNPEAEDEPVSGEAFMEYLSAHAGEYPLAATYMSEVKQLFDGLDLLGLSSEERALVWYKMFTSGALAAIPEELLDKEGLGRYILSRPAIDIASSVNDAPAPVIELEQ